MTTKEIVEFLCNIAKEVNNVTGTVYDDVLALYDIREDGAVIPNITTTSSFFSNNEKVYKYCHGNNRAFGEFCFLSQSIALWRENKIVYSFDEDMERLLIKQNLDTAGDEPLPINVLKSLPYHSFFIKTEYTPYRHVIEDFQTIDKSKLPPHIIQQLQEIENTKPLGFFVNKEMVKTENGYTEAIGMTSVLYNDKTGVLETRNSVIPLNISSLKEAVDTEISRINSKLKAETGVEITEGTDMHDTAKRAIFQPYNEALQLLLYLCVDNKEEVQDEENKVIYKKPSNPKFSKFKPREIKELILGQQTGLLVRKIKHSSSLNYYEKGSGMTGRKKAPHPRAGHYHHYWTGKGRTVLTLKWIAPTFINKNLADEFQGTVIQVD